MIAARNVMLGVALMSWTIFPACRLLSDML
jgi:hypothetical protein